jgi:hypothetical protein
MSDENAVDPGQNGSQDPDKAAEEQRIPYSRFEEVLNQRRTMERELAEARDRLQEIEDAGKSDLERERAARTKAEAQFSKVDALLAAEKKGRWVRSAATELGFHDPEDAVAHLGDKLAGLEDERDAKRLVKTLAQSKKHLVRDDDAKKEQRPRIGRVFSAEERQAQQDQRPLNRNQLAAQREAEFAHSLAEELGKFKSNWREMGGIT